MFLIVGIQPKTKVLDENPNRCPSCGLHQAYNKRIDHYFQFFFIPIARVKKGEPFVQCNRCHHTKNEFKREYSPYQDETGLLCKHCGSPVHKGFYFCPYCGKKI